MKVRLLKRITAFMIIAVVTVTGISVNAFVQRDNAGEMLNEIKEDTQNSKEPKIVKELKDLRTENSTTYLLSNGSRKLEINGINSCFQKDGKFVEYNSDLKEITQTNKEGLRNIAKECGLFNERKVAEYEYVNTAGNIKQYFPKVFNEDTGIVLQKDIYAIAFAPILKEHKQAETIERVQMEQNESSQNKEERNIQDNSKKRSLNIKENYVEGKNLTYIDNSNRVEYKYTSNPSYVKEEIILNEKPDSNIFEFTFRIPGMRLEKKMDKSIQMIDEKTETAVAYIDKPNLIDANGRIKYDEVTYEMEQQKNGVYNLKIVVDKNYLYSEDTKYPVVIDPTVVWMDSYLASATVSSFTGHRDTNMKNGESFEVQYHGRNTAPFSGTEYRCYIKTDGTPLSGSMKQFLGSEVESANLKIVEYSDLTKGAGTIEVRTPDSSWNPDTITWNNCPAMGNKIWAEFPCKGVKGTGHNVDLKDWAQAVADGEINNYGLILKAKEKGTRAYFYGSSLKNSRYMQLSIVYWPYKAVVNHYYDNGYNVRYRQAEYGNTLPADMIKEHQSWVSSVFGKLFGLKITTNSPQLYTSIADLCKTKQGLTVNTTTIEQKCPGGAAHGVTTDLGNYSTCTSPYGVHRSFIENKPSSNICCEVLWSGNLLDNNPNWTWYNSIFITWIRNPNTRYEAEKRTLLHELGHNFGAPDEYCGNSNLPRDEDCGKAGCPIHHPERNDGDCIMGTAYYDNVTTQPTEELFCKYCKENKPTGIPYHLESHHKVK